MLNSCLQSLVWRLSLGAFVVVALVHSGHAQTLVAQEKSAKSLKAARQKFYQSDVVQTIKLEIAEGQLKRMHAALPERIYVPATFTWRDSVVQNVAVRFKGNSSTRPEQRHKRSFLIKFDKYVDDQRFIGLQRASLDNGIQFGSLFSEPIVTEILRDLGVISHRANYAKLILNGKFHGVYVNVERIDQTFIDRNLPDKKGALFKIDLGGRGANLQFIGENPAAYRQAFERKTDSAKKNMPQLTDFIRFINQAPKDGFAKKLEAKLDVDSFMKVMPVMLYAGAFDQLTGWNAHNYYLYRDGDRDRWLYMPWDLDVGFFEVAFGKIHVLADWNAAWPIPAGVHNPLLERIVGDPDLLKRYRASAKQILEKYFEPERLTKVIDAKYGLIEQDLKSDPFPHNRATSGRAQEDYPSIVRSIKSFARKRYTSARQQLAAPGERPKPVRRPGPNQEPQPGKPSKDAPTMLIAKPNESNEVVLSWQDNAEGEAGHIVQRGLGAKGQEFKNYRGLPGKDSSRTTDRNVQPGQIYRYRVYGVLPTPLGPKGTGVSNVVTVKIPTKS